MVNHPFQNMLLTDYFGDGVPPWLIGKENPIDISEYGVLLVGAEQLCLQSWSHSCTLNRKVHHKIFSRR